MENNWQKCLSVPKKYSSWVKEVRGSFKGSKTKLTSNLCLVDKLSGCHELTVHHDSSLKIPVVDHFGRRDNLFSRQFAFEGF